MCVVGKRITVRVLHTLRQSTVWYFFCFFAKVWQTARRGERFTSVFDKSESMLSKTRHNNNLVHVNAIIDENHGNLGVLSSSGTMRDQAPPGGERIVQEQTDRLRCYKSLLLFIF